VPLFLEFYSNTLAEHRSNKCRFKRQFMLGLSETDGVKPCQARKENSPTSGLLRFLVARGGICQVY
jgi:hypothetical protein